MMNVCERKIQSILDRATDSGEECGLQLAIYRDGKLELSLCSGYTSAERDVKVTQDSLFPIFSCGKGVVATAVHQLVEKGMLDYNVRIADYWPEFSCNGKEDIRLWHVMSHRTGLHQLPPLDSFEQQADWELMCRKMAEARPVWKPGTKCGYQSVTYAWLVGETVRRITGKYMQDIISDNILKPLKIEKDFFFGTTPEADLRCVDVTHPDKPESWCADFYNCLPIRHGFVPSANGCATAEALGRHYAALVSEWNGIRLLQPETLEQVTKLCRWEKDSDAYSTWSRFGYGYALPGDASTLNRWFGHGGALGGEGFADKTEHWALAFTKNQDLPTHPIHPVRAHISQALGITERIW